MKRDGIGGNQSVRALFDSIPEDCKRLNSRRGREVQSLKVRVIDLKYFNANNNNNNILLSINFVKE